MSRANTLWLWCQRPKEKASGGRETHGKVQRSLLFQVAEASVDDGAYCSTCAGPLRHQATIRSVARTRGTRDEDHRATRHRIDLRLGVSTTRTVERKTTNIVVLQLRGWVICRHILNGVGWSYDPGLAALALWRPHCQVREKAAVGMLELAQCVTDVAPVVAQSRLVTSSKSDLPAEYDLRCVLRQLVHCRLLVALHGAVVESQGSSGEA